MRFDSLFRLASGVAGQFAVGLLAIVAKASLAAIAQAPLLQAQSVPPVVLLTVGRDEKLYLPAYNDYSDIDGDGMVDIGYRPAITYFGYFDSAKCYTYSATNKRFEPSSVTADKKCSAKWSGDFLNYLTTSRIDALRRVFYGGKRSTDASETVLERAYIPQDAHTWGREYDPTVDSYLISDYTPLAQPASGKRHLFANTSLNTDTATPLLQVLTDRSERIWDWVSRETTQGGSTIGASTAVSPSNYVVRVLACVSGLLEPECKGYPSGAPTSYKPTGVLHEYGEGGSVKFGLLSGSFQNQRSGGVLRKNVDSFDDEVDAATGRFTSVKGIVYQLDRFKIAQYVSSSYPSGCGAGNCKDFGNPVAEMMYEGLRYLGGGGSGLPQFVGGSLDTTLDMQAPAWLDPYRTTTGGNPYCAKPVQMVVSDVYPTYDSDQLPGSAFASFSAPANPSKLSAFNAAGVAATISTAEGIGGGYFIGHSLDSTPQTDRSPSKKQVTSLGRIRGLAPAEPTREGSYYAASVARFGRTNDISAAQDVQNVTTYAVALAAPLPKLSFKTSTGTNVAILPFAQSVGQCPYGDFGPATTPMPNRIAAFYVDKIVNIPGFKTDAATNGGRPWGKFRVSYEDNVEGTDNDMDTVAIYEFSMTDTGKLTIKVTSEYANGCILAHMGFIVSGTTADRAYLAVRDRDGEVTYSWSSLPYCVDTPLNDSAYSKDPGKCPNGLGWAYERTFDIAAPGAADANLPRDPLFYAAKWGGPGVDPETFAPAQETVVNGLPSVPGYMFVSNPATLRAQLQNAFASITQGSGATTAAVATGAFVRSASAIFLPGFLPNAKLDEIDRESDDSPTFALKGISVWDGLLEAKKFVTTSGVVSLAPLWKVTNSSFPGVNAAAKTTSRRILTKIGANPSALLLPANLDATLVSAFATATTKTLLASFVTAKLGGSATTAQKDRETADQVALYLLGDRSREQRKGGQLRSRRALLADIVNSTPAYQFASDDGWGVYSTTMPEAASYAAFVKSKASKQTVYVGANGGFLHAFDATNGKERWGFLPTTLQTEVYRLADPAYQHRYYIDGYITLSDAYIGGSWKTVLLGALGAGGKAIFAVDVTDPDNPKVLWEFSAGNDSDLGYVISRAQIARLADGTWVAVFANGYESTRTLSAGVNASVNRLFVVRLSDGVSLGTTANLTAGTPSSTIVTGLGAPAVQLRDGILDAAWVGDLQGNLWKYDFASAVKSSTAGSVKVAYSNKPLFTAERSGKRQPITAEPSLVPFFDGGTMVVFGTGKFFESTDVSNVDVQSVYAIRDWSRWDSLTRSNLSTASITDSADTRFFSGTTGWWAGATPKRGWFADLPLVGERVVSPVNTVFGSTIIASLIANSADKCAILQDGMLMAVSPFTGDSPVAPVFDISGDGKVDNSDTVASKVPAGVRLVDPVSLVAINAGGNAVGYDAKGNAKIFLKGSKPEGRRSWRQIR